MIIYPFEAPPGTNTPGSGGGVTNTGGNNNGGNVSIPAGSKLYNLSSSLLFPENTNSQTLWTNGTGFTWFCYSMSISFDTPSNSLFSVYKYEGIVSTILFTGVATTAPIDLDTVFFNVMTGGVLLMQFDSYSGAFNVAYNFYGYTM